MYLPIVRRYLRENHATVIITDTKLILIIHDWPKGIPNTILTRKFKLVS